MGIITSFAAVNEFKFNLKTSLVHVPFALCFNSYIWVIESNNFFFKMQISFLRIYFRPVKDLQHVVWISEFTISCIPELLLNIYNMTFIPGRDGPTFHLKSADKDQSALAFAYTSLYFLKKFTLCISKMDWDQQILTIVWFLFSSPKRVNFVLWTFVW